MSNVLGAVLFSPAVSYLGLAPLETRSKLFCVITLKTFVAPARPIGQITYFLPSSSAKQEVWKKNVSEMCHEVHRLQ